MKKPSYTKSLIALLLFFCPNFLFSQTFVGASSFPADGAATTNPGPTVTVAPPGGAQTPVAGDLIVIYAQYRGNLAVNSMSVSTTGGQAWMTASNPAGANTQTFGIFWCRYNGTLGANPVISVAAGNVQAMSAVMYVFRPTVASKGWRLDVAPVANATASNATQAVTITGVTPVSPNNVTMAFWTTPATNTWSGATWTYAGNTQYRNSTTTGQSQSAAYKIQAAAGATGNVTNTRSAGTLITTEVIASWAEGTAPANDLCASAISLTSGTTCVTTAGNLDYASYTSGGGVPGACLVTHDVWYSFVAQTTNPTVTVGGALANPRFQIYSGSCGSLTSVLCSGSGSQAAAGLTIGSTYYVRVYSSSSGAGAFTICVTDPAPANDLCAGAITLTSGSSCTNIQGNVIGATLTAGVPAPACGAPTYDIWYSFTALTSNPTITISGNTNFANPHIQILSGTCAALANVSCSATGTLTAAGLTVGTTYLVRVYSTSAVPTTNGTFNICITDPAPANDNCAAAASINSNTACVTTSGGLGGATNVSVGSCNPTSPDVWYSFVAQSVNPTITLGGNLGANGRFQVFSGNCASLTSVFCSGSNSATVTPNITMGQTYYVRVYSATTANNFTICIVDPAAANGTCGTATVLTPGATCVTIPGNLAASNQTNPTGSCGNFWDVWYTFTVPAGNTFASITVTPTGSSLTSANTFIEAFKSTCAALNNNSLGCNSVSASANLSVVPGNTYFFRVYTTSNPTGVSANYAFNVCVTTSNQIVEQGGRMSEVFKKTILSTNDALQYPWEVTYGPDGFLWVTEAKGYKAYRIDPTTGAKSTIVDITQGSVTPELTGAEHTAYNVEFPVPANVAGCSCWPQGGFAGLAIHPQFNSGKPYVYISYVKRYVSSAAGNAGVFFTNYLVRFTYNSGTGKLGSPVTICDTLPGSSDHNSQRVTIAPVGGTYYLFYAQGDMGAGQFGNAQRPNQAQVPGCYEGKILRFNLEPDADAGAYDKWIPFDNPYNGAKQSAVWAMGIRNNQGLVYDTSTHLLYGSSHGPFSDDEINIIQPSMNYGHPFVEGFAADHNYDGISAGAAPNMNPPAPSACPVIGNEVTNAAALTNYKDPLFSAYHLPTPVSPTNYTTMSQLWNNTAGANNIWPSEGWSGLDLYSSSLIPGWKRSLVAAGLKWGRLIRLRLGATGTTTLPSNLADWNNTGDTVTYFQSTNRYRDLAFGPNGKDIYVIMDNSSATSGPGIGNPTTPGCPGCLVKYAFLGYNVNTGSANRSYISTSIAIAPGKNNTCDSVNTVTINTANANNNLWVPLTDTSSNIVAEIYAMGQNLGNVTAKVYHNSNAVRSKNGLKYLDRNITITPQFQPGGNVKIRLYITQAEYNALQAASPGVINNPTDVKIFKNSDPCGSSLVGGANNVPMDFSTEAFGANGYVLQGTISSFSTFYFGPSSMITLPVSLLSFTGSLQADNTTLLKWQTANEINTSSFVVERSTDGHNFQQIGTVAAVGSTSNENKYSFVDQDVTRQSVSTVFYRLKTMDNDGSYTYSDVVTITLPLTTSKVSLYPNPAVHEVNVTITTAVDGKVKWQLIDNAGRIVTHNTIVVKKGNNNLKINLNRVSAGTYFINVSGGDIDQKIKLEKL